MQHINTEHDIETTTELPGPEVLDGVAQARIWRRGITGQRDHLRRQIESQYLHTAPS